MPMIAAAGSVAGSVIGGIMAGNAQKKAQAAAEAALAQARDIIEKVGAPPDLSAKIIMDQFQQVGLLTPEMEQAFSIELPKAAQIQEDKQLRETQMGALSELKKRGRVGLTPEEKAQYNLSRRDVQKDLEAKNQQIAQEMAMRGQAGGGQEIASRLLASQEGADRASEEADRINAIASSRALQAYKESADLGGNIRAQDFNVAQAKAGAEDEFNRFNVQNQIGREQRNVGSRNVAQGANLQVKQQIASQNVDQANNERLRQAEAKRQLWQDQLQYAQARANPFGRQADMAMQSGQNKANSITGMASGIGSAFGSLAKYYGSKPSASEELAAVRNKYGSIDDTAKEGGYW